MKQIPQFVRRLPYVFYALAIVVGLWRYWNDWTVAEASMQFATGGSEFDQMRFMSRSTALYWGVVEAAYLVANGGVIHVLVAIYDKVSGAAE
ncbi:hypothetical protein [Altererythrobacter lutimaris]|uniref:Uncharacterized protein n=1 Tax=Altererythrobacter lutimaris TaxID=2743979 RepID=A0A850H8V7_9SPHN|nr:hypothetical protein [Altererythrobacter lutimaris]NVE93950.1 hypothetical protein [Altererythrobacter lutimaris]